MDERDLARLDAVLDQRFLGRVVEIELALELRQLGRVRIHHVVEAGLPGRRVLDRRAFEELQRLEVFLGGTPTSRKMSATPLFAASRL